MRRTEEGFPYCENLINRILREPKVSEEEVRNEDDINEYHNKIMRWGIDWASQYSVCLSRDRALVEHTRGIEEFWMIEHMGVLIECHEQGNRERMLDDLKVRARVENLPIFVFVYGNTAPFYISHGFRIVHSFNRENEDGGALARWDREATR
ncbi:hypothetical protein F5Y10DRAFT_234530 [Nemania abortiva]|nr:hypothetical protein F5Y10DRAFT_234530 [Nemania abortiva]